MRREWPFIARWAAWRNGCWRTDASRVLSELTDAFVDRRAIDWPALSERIRGSRERAAVRNLYLLDCLRRPGVPEPRPCEIDGRSLLGARIVVAVASVQTACGLGAIAAAAMSADFTGYRTPQILLSLAFAAAGVLLVAAGARDPRSVLLLAAFAASSSAFARAAAAGLPDAYASAVAPIFHGIVPEAFTPACLWRFALDFPRVRRFTRFDVFARRVTAAAWLLGLLLFGTNLAFAYGSIGEPYPFLLRDHPANGFWSLYAALVVPALGAILVRSRRADAAERRRLARFAFAIAAGSAPLLLVGLARVLLPSLDDWFRTAAPAERRWLDRLIVGSLTSTPFLVAAALVVDRPFGLAAILPPASRARLARLAVTAAGMTPVAALLGALYEARHLPLAEVFSSGRGWRLLAYAAAGCAFFLARPTLLKAIERRGFGFDAGHDARLVGALERVRTARGAREIGAVLARELDRGLDRAARVLVPGPGGVFLHPAGDAQALEDDSAIVAMLRVTAGPIDVSPDGSVLPLLPDRDRAWLAANDVALASALKYRDNQIAAIVVFGPKRGARPFTRQDRWLLTTLSSTAAAAWDREQSSRLRVDGGRRDAGGGDEAAFECGVCGVVGDSMPLPCGCGGKPGLGSLPRHLGDKFRVERRLGAGGMGVVYLARDLTLDREVALKTLPNLHDDAVPRLRDEACVMAALNHESIATIYGFEVWRRTPVLVVEYFSDGTLARRLAEGPMPAAAATTLGVELARALVYLHGKGILHRDIKPTNIGLTESGTAKLLDFGLVTRSDDLAGTRAYMPPEAFRGAQPSPAFDLWALSVVLCEAVSGSRPSHSGRMPVPVTTAWNDFFSRALADRPALRFQTARELFEALESAAGK